MFKYSSVAEPQNFVWNAFTCNAPTNDRLLVNNYFATIIVL